MTVKKMMQPKILHGLYKTYTGSSELRSSEEIVICTIQGPSYTLTKADNFDNLTIETKFKHSQGSKPHEAFVSEMINKLLLSIILTEIDQTKSIIVNIYSNTYNLSMICNSAIIACIDGGIPLKTMPFCIGKENMIVLDGDRIILEHFTTQTCEDERKELLTEASSVKENILHALKDMLEFD